MLSFPPKYDVWLHLRIRRGFGLPVQNLPGPARAQPDLEANERGGLQPVARVQQERGRRHRGLCRGGVPLGLLQSLRIEGLVQQRQSVHHFRPGKSYHSMTVAIVCTRACFVSDCRVHFTEKCLWLGARRLLDLFRVVRADQSRAVYRAVPHLAGT